MTDLTPWLNQVHCMDALALLAALPDGSVDAVITDLPYGVTQNTWDAVIPFEPMWAGVKRVLKPRGVFVTTASQPFTSKLVMSNLEWFREELVWNKVSPVDHLNVHKRHMKQHENVLVFGMGWDNYNPTLSGVATISFGKVSGSKKSVYGVVGNKKGMGIGYPKSILSYPRPNNLSDGGLHPTQKPLDLYKYLIRTYTQPGDVVLDFCCGSGTTALAAAILNRQYIAGDTDAGYCAVARKRLAAYTPDMFEVMP